MNTENKYNCNNSQFDIRKHKETYVNYLEVVILENGTVEYAHPSHQEKLAQIAANRLNITKPELIAMCPPEYYFDFMNWLVIQSKAIAVWNDFIVGTPNKRQLTKLKQLKLEGLYKGSIKYGK